MEAVKLFLDRHCSWECVYCTLRHEQRPELGIEHYRERLRAPRPGAVTRLLISGGEPSTHPLLTAIVSEARSAGFTGVVIETNGEGVTPERISALREAGLTGVDLSVISSRPDLAAALSGVEHAGRTLGLALRAGLEAGLEVVARVPLTRYVLLDVERTLDWLADMDGLSGVTLDWLPARTLRDPARAWTRPHQVRELWARVRSRVTGTPIELRVEAGVAACLAPDGEYRSVLAERYARTAHSEGAGRFAHAGICGACPQKAHCPGFSEHEHKLLALKDIEVPSAPVPLPTQPGEHAHHRTKTNDMSLMTYGAEETRSAVVRINYRCQMTCSFCWVDLHGGEKVWAEIQAEIDQAAGAGCRQISFSGGEPTLSRNFAEAIRYAGSRGFSSINVETNAMLLRKPERADEVVEAGLSDAFVSLHAVDPDISDKITGVPGGFPQTIQGIGNLLDRGVRVVLNYVIHRDNVNQLGRFPGFVQSTFESRKQRPGIRFSAAHVINQRVSKDSVARFSDIAAPLRQALEDSLRLDLDVKEVGGQCGVPPCVLDGDTRFFPLEHRVSHSDTVDESFAKVGVCSRCVYDRSCVGVRRTYLELFGEEEFRPVEVVPV